MKDANSNQWSQLDLDYSSQRQEIVDTLAHVHRHASILSTLPCSRKPKNISRSQVKGGLITTPCLRGKLDKTWFSFQADGCDSDDGSGGE
jgi:hypothetical protein